MFSSLLCSSWKCPCKIWVWANSVKVYNHDLLVLWIRLLWKRISSLRTDKLFFKILLTWIYEARLSSVMINNSLLRLNENIYSICSINVGPDTCEITLQIQFPHLQIHTLQCAQYICMDVSFHICMDSNDVLIKIVHVLTATVKCSQSCTYIYRHVYYWV